MSLFVKRFIAALPALAIATALMLVTRAFLMKWLPTQSWYVGPDSARYPFALDTETRGLIWDYFISPLWLSVFAVGGVNALVAAALNITQVRNRWLAASAATVLFLPFWLAVAGPWTDIPGFSELFILAFHTTAVALFFLSLTCVLVMDRRW